MKDRTINSAGMKKRRQTLRNRMTDPERKLWFYLRKKQFLGIKFRRQVSVGKYIVDFFSFEEKLIIELDGESHFVSNEQLEYDTNREQFLKKQGYRVIRFLNSEIMGDMQMCLGILKKYIEDTSPLPTSPERGGVHHLFL